MASSEEQGECIAQPTMLLSDNESNLRVAAGVYKRLEALNNDDRPLVIAYDSSQQGHPAVHWCGPVERAQSPVFARVYAID